MNTNIRDIRDCFFDEVLNIANADPEIVIVTNDMDVFSLRQFRVKFPERFINVGVAEQNMINIAAGLASCGKKVVVYGITPFLVYRCFEQIKFNICSMNLPVIIAGVGMGLAFSYDGPTHHATHDIGVLNTLPEMEIYNPGDVYVAKLTAQLALKSGKPTFVRIDKGEYPLINDVNMIVDGAYSILKPLQKINIITTGSMTQSALEISEKLRSVGVNIGVVDLFKLKSIPTSFIENVLIKSKKIITLEEHSADHGIGSIISNICAKHVIQVIKFGTEDKQVFDYGERDWLLNKMNLETNILVNMINGIE